MLKQGFHTLTAGFLLLGLIDVSERCGAPKPIFAPLKSQASCLKLCQAAPSKEELSNMTISQLKVALPGFL